MEFIVIVIYTSIGITIPLEPDVDVNDAYGSESGQPLAAPAQGGYAGQTQYGAPAGYPPHR